MPFSFLSSIYIVGGYPLGYEASNTTEIIVNDQLEAEYGPPPPFPIFRHCLVTYENEIWMIGGRELRYGSQVVSNNTYKLDESAQIWTKTSNELIIARELHTCAVTTLDTTETIVIGGGFDENGIILPSIELFTLSAGFLTGKIRSGP